MALALGTAPASALVTQPPFNCGNLFGCYKRVDEGSRPPRGGLYVIGDSISARGWREIVGTGRAAGFKTYVRARNGFDTGYQMFYDDWPNGVPSFTDAARSSAKAVLVQLGTNDAECLHRSKTCRKPPPDDSPLFARWYRRQLGRIVHRMKAGIDQLLVARKCVIWAGPREVDTRLPGRREDFERINGWLRKYSRRYSQHTKGLGSPAWRPEKLVYADWDAAVHRSPALKSDLVAQTDSPPNPPDPVHPQTQAARQAVANFEIRYAKSRCGLRSR